MVCAGFLRVPTVDRAFPILRSEIQGKSHPPLNVLLCGTLFLSDKIEAPHRSRLVWCFLFPKCLAPSLRDMYGLCPVFNKQMQTSVDKHKQLQSWNKSERKQTQKQMLASLSFGMSHTTICTHHVCNTKLN